MLCVCIHVCVCVCVIPGQLYLAAELHLDMTYYNEKLSVWEPLIEPVMEKEGVYRPWEVLVKVRRVTYLVQVRCFTSVAQDLRLWEHLFMPVMKTERVCRP